MSAVFLKLCASADDGMKCFRLDIWHNEILMKKKRTKKKKPNLLLDYVKTVKKLNREAMLESGAKPIERVVKSKKVYTRKKKHRGGEE